LLLSDEVVMGPRSLLELRINGSLRHDNRGIFAVKATEKFTVEITESGVNITSGEGISLHFSALEALMLLDILKDEEANLRRAADEASPLPIRIHL
jgi:hypothetical protein